MKKEDENNLYAKWLAGDLSAEEKEQLKNNGDDEILRKIVNTMDTWSLPDLKESTFVKTKEERSRRAQAKIIPLYKKTSVLAIAASLVIILIGSWYFFLRSPEPQMMEFSCSAGKTKEFVLPDCTLIRLSGASKLALNLNEFGENREVKLEGEAYFSVRKKGDFEVVFSGGAVKVLGTQFDILSDKELISVKCYEGKVAVDLGPKTYRLEKGNGVRKIRSEHPEPYLFKEVMPEAGLGEIRFENAPLAEVCSSLSLFYNVSIETKEIDLSRSFTGMYKKSSLDTALLMVFEPMDIRFEHKGNSVTLKNK